MGWFGIPPANAKWSIMGCHAIAKEEDECKEWKMRMPHLNSLGRELEGTSGIESNTMPENRRAAAFWAIKLFTCHLNELSQFIIANCQGSSHSKINHCNQFA